MKLYKNKKWNFDTNISGFPIHIRKSVPFYEEGHNLILDFSDYFIQEKSVVYELGCSHGELSFKLAKKFQKIKSTNFIGIDLSKKMINYASKHYKFDNLEYIYDDIVDYNFQKSDFFVCYYTLQFLSAPQKKRLIKKIYTSLNPGGCLIIFDKVFYDQTTLYQKFQNAYENFKLRNKLTIEEIYLKNKSLIGIMKSLKSSELKKLFKNVGFKSIELIFKCHFFEGYIVIKN